MSDRKNENLKIVERGKGLRPRVQFVSDKPSMTQQAPSIDTDINKIVATFSKVGGVPPPLVPPRFGDLTRAPKNLQDALQLGVVAKEAFMRLPSGVRDDMDNDPGKLEAWLRDPRNKDLAVKYGLVEPTKAPKQPSEAPGAPPPAPTPPKPKEGV